MAGGLAAAHMVPVCWIKRPFEFLHEWNVKQNLSLVVGFKSTHFVSLSKWMNGKSLGGETKCKESGSCFCFEFRATRLADSAAIPGFSFSLGIAADTVFLPRFNSKQSCRRSGSSIYLARSSEHSAASQYLIVCLDCTNGRQVGLLA